MPFTVLLVEDSPTQALQLRMDLESQGFEVLVAENGTRALTMARREYPDAILSDILMPDMDGFELCQQIRADPELNDTAIMLNSATYQGEEDHDFALNVGADEYVAKGTDPDDLGALLRHIIAARHQNGGTVEARPALDYHTFREQHADRLLNQLMQEASALEQANETLQQRAGELEANRQAARSLAASLDVEAAWNAVSTALERTVGWDVCALLLIEPGRVKIKSRQTLSPEAIEAVQSDLLGLTTSESAADLGPVSLEVETETSAAQPSSGKRRSGEIKTSLAAPLVARDKHMGAVGVYRFERAPFSEDSERSLSTIVAQAAIAIQNARLMAATERRARNMETLYYVTSTLNRSLNLQTTLDEVVEAALEMVDGDSGSVLLLDPETEELKLHASKGLDDQIVEQAGQGITRGVAWRVIQTRRPLLTQDAVFGPALAGLVPREGIASSVCVPLVLDSEAIGVLNVNSTRPESLFTHIDMVALSHLATEAASAINQARLHQELVFSYNATLEALVSALELRDIETRFHTQRVVQYAVALAEMYGVSNETLTEIERGALLHDIGKIGVPDKILHKPGELIEPEWDIMRTHPRMGYDMISDIEFLAGPAQIVLTHHERWDGEGYPLGLERDAIPLGARIFAIVDTIDAITSDRPYRAARSFETALAEIEACRSTQFDPAMADIALELTPDNWRHLKAQAEAARPARSPNRGRQPIDQ